MKKMLNQLYHRFRQNRLVLNYLWSISSLIVIKSSSLVFWGVIAKSLSADRYGVFTFLFAFFSFFEIVPNWGHYLVFVREFKLHPEKHQSSIQHSIILKAILTLATFFLTYWILRIGWNEYIPFYYVVFWGVLYTFVKCVVIIWESYFTSREQMKYVTYLSAMENCVKLLGIVFCFFTDTITYLSIVYILIASMLSKGVLGFFFYGKEKSRTLLSKFSFDRAIFSHLFFGALPFVITTVAYHIYLRIDILMLPKFVSDQIVGCYGLNVMVIGSASLFGNAISNAFYPAITRLKAESEQKYLRVLFKSLLATGAMAILMSIAIYLGASLFLVKVLGESYAFSVSLFPIFICLIPLNFWEALLHRVFYASKKESTVMRLLFVTLFVNFLGNILLGSYVKSYGIAISTLIAKSLVVCMLIFSGRKLYSGIYRKLQIISFTYIFIAIGFLMIRYFVL